MSTKIIGCLDEDVQDLADSFYGKYYGEQQGGLMPHVFLQHGQFGGWLGEKTFKRFYRGLPGSIRSGIETVRDETLAGLKNFAGDIATGTDWREAGQQRLGEVGKSLAGKFGKKLLRMMTGRGRGRRGRNKRVPRTRTSRSFSSSGVRSGRVVRRRRKKVVRCKRKRKTKRTTRSYRRRTVSAGRRTKRRTQKKKKVVKRRKSRKQQQGSGWL